MMKLEFVKDEESYEVRVVNGDDYEVAGELVKNEDGTWCFNYEDQSVAYDDDLEETEKALRDKFVRLTAWLTALAVTVAKSKKA